MVGRGCIIAAGAVVPEGMEVPDGSVVMGVPGHIAGRSGPKRSPTSGGSRRITYNLHSAGCGEFASLT